MGTIRQAGVSNFGTPVIPGSCKSDWIVAHDSLGATAASASDLVRPLAYSSSNVHPIPVPDGAVGLQYMARYAQGTTTTTTNPVIFIYGTTGAAPNANTGAFADDGTTNVERLDSTGDGNASGLTVTLEASSSNRLRDTTYAYSDVYPTAGGRIDCRGCKYVFPLVGTAANVSGGANTTVELLFRFVN